MVAFLKIVNCDISATVWPILLKFGTAMHISHPYLKVDQMFENLKIQDGGQWPSWKSKKCDVWYLQNRFTNCDEILHGDTY